MKRITTALSALLALVLVSGVAVPAAARTATTRSHDAFLPLSNTTIKSALRVDLTRSVATLPLRQGVVNGMPVWYVITDVSDARLARALGVNFAPKLANVTNQCPGCAQQVTAPSGMPSGMGGRGIVQFQARPDFSPTRLLVPGPTGFPPAAFTPGAVAMPGYSPFVHLPNSTVIFNAPIVATGPGPFDVIHHTNTGDRVMAIDTARMTVDLLFVRGFADGQPIMYLSFESSDAFTAVLERSTFAPGLALSPFPNGGFRPDAARAEIFTFANGQDGTSSPPAQGLTHVINDGANALEANLQDTRVLDALAKDSGDAHNVFQGFPTLRDPRLAELSYSPLWDLNIGMWNPFAVGLGVNRAQTDANTILQLGARGIVTNPGGLPLSSANIIINCPALAFAHQAPTAPQAPPPPLPLPQVDTPAMIANTLAFARRQGQF